MKSTLTIFLFYFSTLATLPLEGSSKRLQACLNMQQQLKIPTVSTEIIAPIFASLVSVCSGIITYEAILNTIEEQKESDARVNRLLSIKRELTRKVIPALVPSSPNWITPTTITLTTTSIGLLFFAIKKWTQFYKKTKNPYTSTLLNFLENWPDFENHAPQFLCEEISALYAEYTDVGASVIIDEKTAKLIIHAFNLFLTEEITLLRQTAAASNAIL